MLQHLHVIYDRENKLYFAGFSNGLMTWAKEIENAQPYTTEDSADEDYETLRALGLDVAVQ